MLALLSPWRWLVLSALAFAALAAWAAVRSTTFRELAAAHGDMAALGVRISPSGQPEAILSTKQVDYHRRIERKYLQASAQPWWPLRPDPREP